MRMDTYEHISNRELWRQGFREMAVLTAIRMKLFDALAEVKEGQVTVDGLAEKTDSEGPFVCEISLFLLPSWSIHPHPSPKISHRWHELIGVSLARIMRFLTVMGYAKELGVGLYAPTKKTNYFVTGSMMIDAIIHLCVWNQPERSSCWLSVM